MATEQEENIQFAKFIEQYRYLYDHNFFCSRSDVDNAWRDVAQQFRIPVRRCKEKWKNMRTVFRRHLFAKPEDAGGSSKKEYYLTDALQYLVPFLRDNPKNTSGGSPLPGLVIDEDDQERVTQVVEETDDMVSELSYAEGNDATDVLEITSTPGGVYPSGRKFRSPKLGKRKANSSLDDAMIQYFKSKANPGEKRTASGAENPEIQSDEHFLLSLKADMKEMNARQKRIFKRKIFDLIDEVLDDGPRRTLEETNTPSLVSSTASRSSTRDIEIQSQEHSLISETPSKF